MPTKSTAFLPKAFRWVFTILELLMGIVAVGTIIAIVVDPTLPPHAHFGPVHGDILGQAADFNLQPAPAGQSEPQLVVHAFNGTVAMTVKDPSGFIEVCKEYGFPLIFIYVLFAIAVLDCMRRLFRSVGRGESFTTQSVRLVQIIGGTLIGFAIVAAIGESVFAHAAFSYLMQHTDIAVGGAPVRLPNPAEHHHHVRFGHWLPFGRGSFWFGLLVLALAEVFRQGLALKRDNELTV